MLNTGDNQLTCYACDYSLCGYCVRRSGQEGGEGRAEEWHQDESEMKDTSNYYNVKDDNDSSYHGTHGLYDDKVWSILHHFILHLNVVNNEYVDNLTITKICLTLGNTEFNYSI